MSTSFSNIDEKALISLNKQIGYMEQQRDSAAQNFFDILLSDQLIFRRADGIIVSKKGKGGFLEKLKGIDSFTAREIQDIIVQQLDDHALVTLIVQTLNAKNEVGRYRNIRIFSKQGTDWQLECWYNYAINNPK